MRTYRAFADAVPAFSQQCQAAETNESALRWAKIVSSVTKFVHSVSYLSRGFTTNRFSSAHATGHYDDLPPSTNTVVTSHPSPNLSPPAARPPLPPPPRTCPGRRGVAGDDRASRHRPGRGDQRGRVLLHHDQEDVHISRVFLQHCVSFTWYFASAVQVPSLCTERGYVA